MTQSSALYFGQVIHQRLRPKRHFLKYRVFWMLLDLDEVEDHCRRLRLFSLGRFNLVSFDPRRHGDGSDMSLREQMLIWLDRAGLDIGDGPIRLLTMPSILGYVFNPISVYYCHYTDGRLAALIYEVTSTFGVRHSYVVPLSDRDSGKSVFKQAASKALYVSPFMDMDMDYVFRGHVPSERLDLAIEGRDADGVLIQAVMAAQRRPLNDRNLLSAVVMFPLLTFKVVAAIHWEALKLWLKGVALTRQPAPPKQAASVQSKSGLQDADL